MRYRETSRVDCIHDATLFRVLDTMYGIETVTSKSIFPQRDC